MKKTKVLNDRMSTDDTIQYYEIQAKKSNILALTRGNEHIKDIYQKASKKYAREAEALRKLWGNKFEMATRKF